MKKKIIISVLLILLIVTGCKNKVDDNKKVIDNNESEMIELMKINIDGKEYNVHLENNETVNEFIKLLPQELEMNELNGNEKYVYLDTKLPTNSHNPKHINKGDVMLYGNNCLVIFYKSFDTSYSYTKIGFINDLPDLGENNVFVKITR